MMSSLYINLFLSTFLHNLSTSIPSLFFFVSIHSQVSTKLFNLMASYNEEGGKPLPKFGEWDVNDPASAEGFTVIFNKARDDKKLASASGRFPSQRSKPHQHKLKLSSKKKWFCFVPSTKE